MSRSATPPFDVTGRTVFITGAARGIGAASAARLHAKGANVALVGLEAERLEQNAAQLGDRAAWFEADVTDLAALQRAVEATVERFGGIDVAIANAGISYSGALATAPIEQIERTLAVNLLGVWRTDRAVIAELSKRRGYLLNVASLSAISHSPLMGAYTTAKSGVEALSDALRMEMAPSGVAVGCAYFGFIDTDLVRAGFAQPSAQGLTSQLPAFVRNPAPLPVAIDAIERGIERRAGRVWAPRWIGPMLLLRGLLQPLSERRLMSNSSELSAALRTAETSGESEAQDSLLGVAAQAIAGGTTPDARPAQSGGSTPDAEAEQNGRSTPDAEAEQSGGSTPDAQAEQSGGSPPDAEPKQGGQPSPGGTPPRGRAVTPPRVAPRD